MPADFEKQTYWHDRFATETSFEWLTSSATFMSFVEPYLDQRTSSYSVSPPFRHKGQDKAGPRILHLGSGTSDLHTYFRARGYLDVTNVDYEPLALERGRQIEKNAFGGDAVMKYALADVTRLRSDLSSNNLSWDHPSTGPDSDSDLDSDPDSRPRQRSFRAARHTFDLVVDKSTVDAVSCGGEEAFIDMVRSVRECIASDGLWISLSYSATRFQLPAEYMPFDVRVIGKIASPKSRPADPDIYYWCYLLQPR
jgi:EEF1A lysine methyltransferase 4